MEEVLKDLEDALVAYKQEDFLTTEEIKTKTVLVACVKLLRFNGYKITEPNITIPTTVSTYKDLLGLYNANVALHYGPDEVHYRDGRRDTGSIRNFVNNRIKVTGAGPKAAKQECALIIDTIFTNLKEFNFNTPPRVNILDSKKWVWAIEKALEIMSKKNTAANVKRHMELLDDSSSDFMQGSGIINIDDL